MFTAKVYNVMLGSLSGAMEEEFAAKEVIRKWNQQNAEREGKVFLNVEWITNADELRNVDVLIGIVGNWIGDTRFVEACIESGKQLMLFFNAYQDPRNTIARELNQVKVLLDRVQPRCRCINYRSTSELMFEIEQTLNEM